MGAIKKATKGLGKRLTKISLITLLVLGLVAHLVNRNTDESIESLNGYHNNDSSGHHVKGEDGYYYEEEIQTELPYILGVGDDEHFTTEGIVYVTFLDVGQGDSIIIRSDDGVALIDAGSEKYAHRIIAYLEHSNVDFIDVVVATHPHADHIGGLIDVLGNFEVGVVYMPNAVHTTRTFERFIDRIEQNQIPIQFLSGGDIFELGVLEFAVFSPNEDHNDLNNMSLVLRMEHFTNSFLFAADAEELAEVDMINFGYNLTADVLKVGHHGSATSTTRDFLQAVNPTYAIIQTGDYNQFGHPHNTILNRLASAGVSVYRTDIHGNIRFYSDGFNLLYSTGR